MMGDFNFGDINWQTLSAESSVSDAFCDFVFNNNLEQLIQSPTHCLGNIFDLVITNCSSLVDSPTVMSTGLTDTCDHCIITFNILTCLPSRCVEQSCYILDFAKADYDKMNCFFSEADFSPCLDTDDIELAWSKFITIVRQAISKYVPKIKLHKNKYPKWFTSRVTSLTKSY